ncbi:mok11 [Symbiodinium sp. KB8]|nr:mok11 [Symbiodinium sp. KB8]
MYPEHRYLVVLAVNSVTVGCAVCIAKRNIYAGTYAQLDFTTLDMRLGTLEELRKLTTTAHDLGMYVIVDVVMNHMANEFYFEGHAESEAPWRFHETLGFYKSGQRAPDLADGICGAIKRDGSDLKAIGDVVRFDDSSLWECPEDENDLVGIQDYLCDLLRWELTMGATTADKFEAMAGIRDTAAHDPNATYNGTLYGQFGEWVDDDGSLGDLIDYFDPWQINYGKIYGVMDDLRLEHARVQQKYIAMTKALIESADVDGYRVDTPMQADEAG